MVAKIPTLTLCAIFNASVRQGFVPARWKEATIVPVPKNYPPRSIQSDLRPISLTATLGKILESFIGAWILELVGDTLDKCTKLQFIHSLTAK